MRWQRAHPLPRLGRRFGAETAAPWAPLLGLARNVGVGVTGTRGVGKSTLLFLIAWLDAVVYDKAMVVIAPVPQVIDLFFSQLCRLHPDDQAVLWPKIRYLNLSGQAVVPNAPIADWRVLPTPIYYTTGIGFEDAFEVSQRLPETLVRLEPKLKEATVQGYKAVWNNASHAGRILSTCGLGITHMYDLLTNPESPYWRQKFAEAVRKDPSVAPSVAYFRTEYATWTPGRRDERTHALMTRLSLFSSPLMQAQFGAAEWAVPWKTVVEQRLKVFVDVSREHSDEARRFKLLWIFTSLIDFIKRYGATQGGDRSHPISLIVDEIAAIIGKGESPIATDLDELINTYSRNYNIEFVTSFQEPYQLADSPAVLDSLLSLGSKFYARMTDPKSSRLIADRAIPYDPYDVKEVQYRRVGGLRGFDEPHNVYFSKQEQTELGRQRFDNLGRLEFLAARTVSEGQKPLPLAPYSLRPFRIPPPDAAAVADAKRRLALRDGLRVADVLATIAPAPSGGSDHDLSRNEPHDALETDF